MKWLKKKIKTTKWRLKIVLLWIERQEEIKNKWLAFVKEQTIIEKEQHMFKFVSKHASKRLKERMLYWWYTMEDIHRDIIQSNERYKRKEWTRIVWKLWTYIISQAGNLITVI